MNSAAVDADVSNGSITAFGTGVYLASKHSTVQQLDVRVTTNNGALLVGADDSTVCCTRLGGSKQGVRLPNNTGASVVSNATVASSVGIGIWVQHSTDVTVRDNVLAATEEGIVITRGSSQATITLNNLTLGLKGDGILLSNSIPLAVTATGAATTCASTNPANGAANISRNSATGGAAGIAVECGDAHASTLSGNTAGGQRVVAFYDTNPSRYGNTWTGNTGTGNQSCVR